MLQCHKVGRICIILPMSTQSEVLSQDIPVHVIDNELESSAASNLSWEAEVRSLKPVWAVVVLLSCTMKPYPKEKNSQAWCRRGGDRQIKMNNKTTKMPLKGAGICLIVFFFFFNENWCEGVRSPGLELQTVISCHMAAGNMRIKPRSSGGAVSALNH